MEEMSFLVRLKRDKKRSFTIKTDRSEIFMINSNSYIVLDVCIRLAEIKLRTSFFIANEKADLNGIIKYKSLKI